MENVIQSALAKGLIAAIVVCGVWIFKKAEDISNKNKKEKKDK